MTFRKAFFVESANGWRGRVMYDTATRKWYAVQEGVYLTALANANNDVRMIRSIHPVKEITSVQARILKQGGVI